MQPISRSNNFLYLFAALVVTLFASAVTSQFPDGWLDGLFSVVIVAMLPVGVKSLHTDTAWRRIVYALAVALVALQLLVHFYPSRVTLLLIYGALLLFFLGSFKAAVRLILFEGEVDGNKMVGSLSLYLLIGLIWAMIYLIVLVFDPTAFEGIETGEWRHLFFRVTYYSYVTLTTLGYGDIVPNSPIAEFFTSMEAVTGVFYMAVFVSSLINLRGGKR